MDLIWMDGNSQTYYKKKNSVRLQGACYVVQALDRPKKGSSGSVQALESQT